MKKILIILAIGVSISAFAAKIQTKPHGEFVPGIDITPKLEQNKVIEIPILPDARKCHYGGEIETCRSRCWPGGQQVLSCTVKTINNIMTEECVCGNTGLYTENTDACETPAS